MARDNLIFHDPDPARQANMAKLGVEAAPDNAAVMHAQVVVLAVKPQLLERVLAGIKDSARASHLIISIAAGVLLPGWRRRFPHPGSSGPCPTPRARGRRHDLPVAGQPGHPG